MKKKLQLLAFAVSLSITAVAQNQREIGAPELISASELKTNPLHSTSVVLDTLAPGTYPGTCLAPNNGFVFYRVDVKAPMDSGYWYGTNAYAISDIAQKYTVTGTVNVTGILGWVAKKGTNAVNVWSCTASVMNVNATTKAPNTTLGVSSLMSATSFTLPALAKWNFPTMVNVSNSTFFAVVNLPAFNAAAGDSLGFVSTKLGCSSTDSLSWLKYNGIWFSTRMWFNGFPNLDIMIWPIVDIPVGIDNSITRGHLTLLAASPNPATDKININFNLAENSSIEIEVTDLKGSLIRKISNGKMAVGKQAVSIDLNGLEAGTYLYSVNANGIKMFNRFVVTK